MFIIDYDKLFNESYKYYYNNPRIISKLSYKDKLDRIIKAIKTDLSNIKIKVIDFKFVSLDKKELVIKTSISFNNSDKKTQKYLKQYKWQSESKKSYKYTKNYVIELTPKFVNVTFYIDFKEFKASVNGTIKKYEDLIPYIKNYLKTGVFENKSDDIKSIREKVVKNIVKPVKDIKPDKSKTKDKDIKPVKVKKQVYHIMISKNKGGKAFYNFTIKAVDKKQAKEMLKNYANAKGIKQYLIDIREESEFKPKNIKNKNLDKYLYIKEEIKVNNTVNKKPKKINEKSVKDTNIKVKIDNIKENNINRIKDVSNKKEKEEIKEKLKVQEPKVTEVSKIKQMIQKTLAPEIVETKKSTNDVDKIVAQAIKLVIKDFDKNDLKYYDNFKKLNIKIVDKGINKGWWQYNKSSNDLLLSSKFLNNINILKNQLPSALANVLADNYNFTKLENKSYYTTKTQDKITKILKDS